jgi:hypothetical protein
MAAPKNFLKPSEVAALLVSAAKALPWQIRGRAPEMPPEWAGVRRFVCSLPDEGRRACLLELLRDEARRLRDARGSEWNATATDEPAESEDE